MQARSWGGGIATMLALVVAAPAGADTISADGRIPSGNFGVSAFNWEQSKHEVNLQKQGPTRMHGQITCYGVTGDRGVAGFVVDKSTDPAWPVGSYGYAYVEDLTKDNTGKPGGSLDAAGFEPTLLVPTCLNTFGVTERLTRGFVFVFDADD